MLDRAVVLEEDLVVIEKVPGQFPEATLGGLQT